jgi:toxin ParE1/3/4
MLITAMGQVADHPDGPATREQSDLASGIRSFHTRHTSDLDRKTAVKRPVHLLIYRVVEPGLVEIVRVLHERMDIRRHLDQSTDD